MLESGASTKRTSSIIESSARVSGAGRTGVCGSGGGRRLGCFSVTSGSGSEGIGGSGGAAPRAGFGPSPAGSGGGFTTAFG